MFMEMTGGEFEIAHMSTSDSIGIELFSFPLSVKEAPEFIEYVTARAV